MEPVGGAGQEHVLRLDVAVDDTRAMRRRQCGAHLAQQVRHLSRRTATVTGDFLGERAAGEVFHHDEGRPVVEFTEIEAGFDPDRRRGAGAGIEPIDAAASAGRAGIATRPGPCHPAPAA